jgi:hypothetical protein
MLTGDMTCRVCKRNHHPFCKGHSEEVAIELEMLKAANEDELRNAMKLRQVEIARIASEAVDDIDIEELKFVAELLERDFDVDALVREESEHISKRYEDEIWNVIRSKVEVVENDLDLPDGLLNSCKNLGEKIIKQRLLGVLEAEGIVQRARSQTISRKKSWTELNS